MKTTLIILGALFHITLFAEEPPQWAQMRRAIFTEPDVAQVKALVQSGLDPNAPIGCGTYAPLDAAIDRQNPELVDVLISLGAKPTESQMVRAAFCSSHDGASRIVAALHAAGAPINAREFYSEDSTRFTQPIHNAVWRHNTALLAYLLKQEGIQMDHPNVDGYTPLMIAVEHGREDMADMLLAAGANPRIRNSDGMTAASIADQRIEIQQRLKAKLK